MSNTIKFMEGLKPVAWKYSWVSSVQKNICYSDWVNEGEGLKASKRKEL